MSIIWDLYSIDSALKVMLFSEKRLPTLHMQPVKTRSRHCYERSQTRNTENHFGRAHLSLEVRVLLEGVD